MDADPRLADSRLLFAASDNSDDWDDATWAAWARTADRIHAERKTIEQLQAELKETSTKLEIAERRNEELADQLAERTKQLNGLIEAFGRDFDEKAVPA
jgi:chromosome segregation ATPase